MGTDYSESLPLLGDLPKHWKVVEFGSILDGGTRNGIYKKKEFHGRGDKIVNMGELFAFSRLFSVPMKRVELSEKEQGRFRLQEGDLLFARRSLVAEGAGKCSLVCEVKEPTSFESSIIRARPNSNCADSLYLFYLFRSPYGAYILDTIRRQVAVAGITGTDLVKLFIPLPPLNEQKEIAHILGTLDDKIELNQQMNRTLEGIARALFKSWFIDFDPVRAKLDGHQPSGMDAETAALFPDAFEDGGAIGKIPRGWRLGTLADIADFRNGKGLSNSLYLETGRYPVYGSNGQIAWTDELLNNESVIAVGRVGAYCGSTHRIDTPSWVTDNAIVVKAKTPTAFEFLCFRLQSLNLSATAVGSAQPLVTQSGLKTIKTIVPPQAIIDHFEKMVRPISQQCCLFKDQSDQLAIIRDTLLPKLLAGEIHVGE